MTSLPRRVLDMTGSRVAHVTVLEYVGVGRHRCARWRVRCDCGTTWETTGGSVRRGEVSSCGRAGCPYRATRTHGHARPRQRSAEYQAWRAMKTRCLNPESASYPAYGGRGITVCPCWEQSFEAFYADVGPRPSPEHSLDRIENSGHYAPGNVRWATRSEQANNRRTSTAIEWQGTTRTVAEWAAALGLPRHRLQARYRAGWRPPQMFEAPARRATVLTWRGARILRAGVGRAAAPPGRRGVCPGRRAVGLRGRGDLKRQKSAAA
jgi:hypothetical protein